MFDFEGKLTLLTEKQAFGIEKLELLRKYENLQELSDLSILTGATFEKYPAGFDFYRNHPNAKLGATWTQSMDCSLETMLNKENKGSYKHSKSVYYIEPLGTKSITSDLRKKNFTIRPVLLLSSSLFFKMIQNATEIHNGVKEIEFLEYGQYAPSKELQIKLEKQYKIYESVFKRESKLRETDGKYTFNNTCIINPAQSFNPITYKEYEYDGKKYIRIMAQQKCELTNGEKYEVGDYVWLEVSPVKWLTDEKTQILLSKTCLVSGIRFYDDFLGYNGDFETTEIKKYLDNYMSKDLFQNYTFLVTNNRNQEISFKKPVIKNSKNMDFVIEKTKEIENEEECESIYNQLLTRQFLEAKGISSPVLNLDELNEEYNKWIKRNRIIGEEYTLFLKDHVLEEDIFNKYTVEVGKGINDSVFFNKGVSIISPYLCGVLHSKERLVLLDVFSVKDGKIVCYDSKGRHYSLENDPFLYTIWNYNYGINMDFYFNNFITQNPYNIKDIENWQQIPFDKKGNIIVGIYGSLEDKDRQYKINMLKSFRDKLQGNYIERAKIDNNNYFYAIANSIKVPMKKMK